MRTEKLKMAKYLYSEWMVDYNGWVAEMQYSWNMTQLYSQDTSSELVRKVIIIIPIRVTMHLV